MAIELIKSKSPVGMTIEQFILWYLKEYGESYVHEMYKELNELSKRKVKYTSFRTIVMTLKQKGYIESTKKEKDKINAKGKTYRYGKSFYDITERGLQHLLYVQGGK